MRLRLAASWAAVLLLGSCGGAAPGTDTPDGGDCPKGYFRAPLGECAMDTRHPPCACVDFDQSMCCGGDVCCGPNDTTCGLGVPTCEDGVVTCGAGHEGGFLSFQNTCK